MRLQNKVAVITGGGSGIGKATAILMAKEGAKVAIFDINDARLKEVVDIIKNDGGNVISFHVDVSKENEVKKAFAETAKRFRKIDILFNNAGIGGVAKPTHLYTEADWDQVMNINLKGAFFCEKYALQHILENKPDTKTGQRGNIILTSSIYGIVGAPDAPAYHASKGAMRLLAKTDAMIYAKDGIRVNSVHPGFIWTPLVENTTKSTGNPEAARQALVALHPIGHLGEPEDIAYGVVYLASDEAKFVTGEELVIDGGYIAH